MSKYLVNICFGLSMNAWNLNQQNHLFESFSSKWSTMQKTRPQQKFSFFPKILLSFQFFPRRFAKGFKEFHKWQGSSIMEWVTEVVSPTLNAHNCSCDIENSKLCFRKRFLFPLFTLTLFSIIELLCQILWNILQKFQEKVRNGR